MEMMGAAFANIINIVIFALIVAGVMKVFQSANTLNEIRDTLKDIRRENQTLVPPPNSPSAMHAAAMQDPDALIRALSAEPEPALNPTVVERS